MKRIIVIVAVVLAALIASAWFVSTQLGSSAEYVIDESDFVDADALIENIPESQLSEEEIAGLVQMREEEKLARDVYLTLGEKGV